MFPTLYHAHHSQYKEDLPFWLDLAHQQGGPVLELGCGTGRVLLPLAQAGFRTVGLDNDLDMLRFLRAAQAPDLQPAPLLFAASLTDFHLAQRFPLVLLPCNTWSVLDAGQRRKALGCIIHHLSPGGIFAASLPNPEFLRDLPASSEADVDETFSPPGDGQPGAGEQQLAAHPQPVYRHLALRSPAAGWRSGTLDRPVPARSDPGRGLTWTNCARPDCISGRCMASLTALRLTAGRPISSFWPLFNSPFSVFLQISYIPLAWL